ncbi:MAG: LysM peptidoglycan-binding domain-containing protein [Pirellulales bacterium]
MSKETKIGLAVIGLLLSVFGVLLFRHLSIGNSIPKWDHEERAAAEPLVPAGASEKPSVVMAQKDGPGSARGPLWGPGSDRASAEPAAEVPSASYMPAETETQTPARGDRYAIGRAGSAAPAVPAERSANANPFQDRRPEDADAGDVQGADEPSAPGALPREESSPDAGRNPLRRLSAELPLEAPQQDPDAEGGAELPVQGADPYADEAPSEKPTAPFDPAELPSEAEPAPAPTADRFAPSVAVPPQKGDPEPPREYDSREPVVDDSRPDPVAGDQGRAPIADDWQPGSVAQGERAGTLPLPVENGMYTVQPNDTLWSISEKVYGTGGYFKAIAAHNRSGLPRSDRLTVGTKVAVPPAGELEEHFPELCPKQRKSVLVKPRAVRATATVPAASGDVYVVEEGDTLFDIARFELGKASRWAEIYELNRGQLGEDFDYLRPGTELRLPARSRAAETISRGGDSGYVR